MIGNREDHTDYADCRHPKSFREVLHVDEGEPIILPRMVAAMRIFGECGMTAILFEPKDEP